MPLEIRLALLFVFGTALGGALNLGIYRLAWFRRSISPWSEPPDGAPPRRWHDRIPVFGWGGLAREAKFHGRGFWLRPLFIELGMGFLLAWLYWWEVDQQALFPVIGNARLRFDVPSWILHAQYFSHVVLIALMVVASFIDVDEKLIPDEITLTGTLAGLVLATVLPWSLLGEVVVAAAPPAYATEVAVRGANILRPGNALYHQFLTFTSPQPWPAAMQPAPHVASLGLALGCFWLWCFAVLERPWYHRRGLRRATAIAVKHAWRQVLGRAPRRYFEDERIVVRRAALPPYVWIIAGTLAIASVWLLADVGWAGLLTALVGLVGGGGIIWAVRLVGAATLRKEAMGFGDVLLMMMVGTFVGWQACLVIFFAAPFAGLIVGLTQWIVSRNQYIPYGPFLCLGTFAVIVYWGEIWDRMAAIFAIQLGGWPLVPLAMIACLFAMAAILLALRRIKVAMGVEE